MVNMANTGAVSDFIEVPTDALVSADIGDRYGNLRLVNPGAYAAMERSIAQYGQVTPLVVGCSPALHLRSGAPYLRLRSWRFSLFCRSAALPT